MHTFKVQFGVSWQRVTSLKPLPNQGNKTSPESIFTPFAILSCRPFSLSFLYLINNHWSTLLTLDLFSCCKIVCTLNQAVLLFLKNITVVWISAEIFVLLNSISLYEHTKIYLSPCEETSGLLTHVPITNKHLHSSLIKIICFHFSWLHINK